MTERRRWDLLSIAAGVALAATCVLGSVSLFAWDADGAFAVNDGLWYAKNAEDDPWAHVSGHHPLFHVALNLVTASLASVGVEHPGHVAARLLSGLAAATICLTLGAMAGRGRFRIGLLCALPLVATRGFIMEAATGENVLPACAAALIAVWLAARPQTGPWKAGLALVIALALRQDNVLLVPGFSIALLMRSESGHRVGTVLRTLAAAGIATLGVYAACWAIGSGDAGIVDWTFDLAEREGRSWAPNAAPKSDDLLPHLSAAGFAVVGLQREPHRSTTGLEHAAVGLGFMLLLLVGAELQRGDRRGRPFAVGAAVILATRFPFFWWFEPLNYEWWLCSLTLIAGMAATITSGRSVTRPSFRRAGACALVLGALLVAALHAPGTNELRDRKLARSRDAALRLGTEGRTCSYLVYGARAKAAFHIVDVPARDDVLTSPDPATVQRQLVRAMSSHPVRTVILLDRWVGDGMPWTLRRKTDSLSPVLDSLQDSPTERYIREGGRVVVVGLHLDK